jgi:hypothetical protein
LVCTILLRRSNANAAFYRAANRGADAQAVLAPVSPTENWEAVVQTGELSLVQSTMISLT